MRVYETIRAYLDRLIEKGELQEELFFLAEAHPLSQLTTFRTGGNATVLFPLAAVVIEKLLPILVRENIPYFVLGNGSNVIAKDEGYPGLILSLEKMKRFAVKGNEITAESGFSVTALALTAKKASLSGIEFFYGIPGSVGGAVFMNAGAYGGECKDVLKSVTYVTRKGEVVSAGVEDLEMGYRTSVFEKNGAIVVEATFSLAPGDVAKISAEMENLMAQRVAKQPLEYPSAGSVFKRYEGRFTAKMIQDAGLKGVRVGGAQVSEKHAGFIINYDHATSNDIFQLIDHVKKVIYEKEGIHIACEVRTIE